MEQKNRRISTRQLVSMAMLGAISIVLVAVIHFPLIPAAAFLEYDPADIPILICAFAYGPLALWSASYRALRSARRAGLSAL